MTTSDHPRADHRDDEPGEHGEHRGLGKRILDAVLGEPAEQRHDRADDPTEDARRDTGQAGHVDPREATRDAGYDPSGSAADARRDAGPAGFADRADTRADAGYDNPVARTAGHDPRDAGRDPLAYDAPHDLAAAGYEDRRPADREPGYGTAGAGVAERGGAQQDFVTGSYDPDRDRGYDPQAAGTAMAAPDGSVADADRSGAGQDFVTSSYDPDRDRGYDPQAAGTAVETDPSQGPVARNTNTDRADYDSAHDTSYVDRGASRDYDPAQDTGYVDAGRAEADRTTGRRDDDYDTGRVDADRTDTGRVVTEPVTDTDRDGDRGDTHRGAKTAAAAGAAGVVGAAAAAVFGSSDRDRDSDRDSDRDTRFSEVDDTVAVDATDTGRSRADTGDQAGIADEDGSSGGRERLVPAERADEYGRRWDALKGDFVDEPRRAVRQADELVGEVLDELQRLFADQRRGLEQSFDHDRASTEDLRLALRRYRSFFDRLLSF